MDFCPACVYGSPARNSEQAAIFSSAMNLQTAIVPSPCTGICKMDAASGLCLGCGSTSDEIAEWSTAGDVRRRAMWAMLPERCEALGVSITRLPWPRDRIAKFVAESLRQRSGTWVLGCYGALAEFILPSRRAMRCFRNRRDFGFRTWRVAIDNMRTCPGAAVA
jgi:predicted Fe-S protein YdhL (DUF1289 family)